jgi:hypothetical protein
MADTGLAPRDDRVVGEYHFQAEMSKKRRHLTW